MVNCLSLWGCAMFGADAVEESLGYVGAVLGPAVPHPGAVAAEPPATVVGGGHGGPLGHESDSSSTSSEGSSSCESSDSDAGREGGSYGPSLQDRHRRAASRAEPRGGAGAASASGRHPHQQPGTGQIGAEFGLWASPVVLKGGGGADRPAGGSGDWTGPPPKRRATCDERPGQGTIQQATGLSTKFQGPKRQSRSLVFPLFGFLLFCA